MVLLSFDFIDEINSKAEAFINQADVSLYKAKTYGLNQFAVNEIFKGKNFAKLQESF
ncbi:MAG: hypothetical protein ACI92O_002169 [Colwellia sp.]